MNKTIYNKIAKKIDMLSKIPVDITGFYGWDLEEYDTLENNQVFISAWVDINYSAYELWEYHDGKCFESKFIWSHHYRDMCLELDMSITIFIYNQFKLNFNLANNIKKLSL